MKKTMELCRRLVCSLLILGLFPGLGRAELLDAGAFRELFDRYRLDPALPAAGSTLPSSELTLVVFPGILAEFFNRSTFADVRDRMQGLSSPLLEEWRRYRQRADQARLWVPDLAATALPDQGMGRTSRALSDLVDLFALPADGQLVHVIVIKSPPFSLETFGDLEVAGDRYEERLNALFSALGWVPAKIAFVGYSLGGTVGYEVIAHATEHGRPWLARLRAFVSLAGIIHGNRLADIALGRVPEAPQLYAELIDALWDLRCGLELVGQARGKNDREKRWILLAHPGTVGRNSALWLRTLRRLADTLWRYRALNGGLTDALPRILQTVDGSALGQAGLFGLDVLSSNQRWWADYDQNILRWKLFLTQAKRVVEQMSGAERAGWFVEHPLELGRMVIHEVHAEMPDDPALAESTSFDPGMIDYQLIRDNLRVHELMTGFAHMDAWVGLEESCNDPARTPQTSPARPAARQPFSCWGEFSTDHWGLGVPNAIPQTDATPRVHPFPRQALLQAISHALLRELAD